MVNRAGQYRDMKHRVKALSTVRCSIRARRIDALLVTSPDNRFYLSGFNADDMGCAESAGALLVTRDRNMLLTDGRYREQAEKETEHWDVLIYRKGIVKLLEELLPKGEFTRIGYEPAFLSCARLNAMEQAMPHLEFVPFGDIIHDMRACKVVGELACIKDAVRSVEMVMSFVAQRIRSGISEKELAWMVLEEIYRNSDGPSFPPIVASGPNAALPHAVPQERIIQPGEPVIIDIGCIVGGYCSDMTRTFFPDAEPDELMKRVYGIVKEAQFEAQSALRAGVPACSVDKVARKIIGDAGYGENFVHSLGHGVGIAVHEAPALSFMNRKFLKPGMVVTVEPGIYLPGKGGVRMENMAVITEDGADILNSLEWYYEF
jgi:Xaa-Pro aminopeptidase